MRNNSLKTLIALGLFLAPNLALADEGPSINDLKVATDTLWVVFAGLMVFFMNAGFGLVESGFCRKKNTVNILAKNVVVFALTTLIYYAVGFGIQYGNGNPYFGTSGWFVPYDEETFSALSWATVPIPVKFFFQLVFAGTAATIVSGAVAERIHYGAFLVFSIVMGAVIYPVGGHWIWGGGFLGEEGMVDFAGSTVVHSVGGWAALAGCIFLGPRLGKYTKDGKVKAIPGHNMTSAMLGTLILWLGWFGFNPGSTMGASSDAIGHILLTTNMAAAAGAVVGTVYTWARVGKPDLGLTLNGCLAGLVAITAPCAFVTGPMSILIGAIGGVIVVEGVIMFDKIKIDDPVGATSVHLLNGIFGTLAIGLFGDVGVAKAIADVDLASGGLLVGGGAAQLMIQLKGVVVVGIYAFAVSSLVWFVIKKTMGLRVSAEDEEMGLDAAEMGMEAYPDDFPRTGIAVSSALESETMVSAPKEVPAE
ncbi:MAG: ammonia permease [Sorangiineae bacterium NIC37A_2]|nr:MAG: ammonia permease [Sorangiineae bacterium NIC37A_2]